MTTLTKPQEMLPGMKMPELEKLERRVNVGLASFIDTGRALMEIQEKKGYLLRGCKTMEEYCEKQFHFSLRQGQRIMIAAETAQKVEKVLGEAPRNEATARVLNPIASEPKLIEKVKKELEKKKLTVATATAEKLQEVVDKIKPQTKPMFDDTNAKPKPPAAIAGFSDVCPNCKRVPSTYVQKGTAWQCGGCGKAVRVGALPLEIAVCNDCGAPLLDESGICRKCGCVQ
ncbi:hypothetical protein ANRL3_02834 [Anaerolineae bacterium]|nr:hypothetical protein ANRL3_02834 [Anaerolineae bacterium]